MKTIVISGIIGADVQPSDIRDQLDKARGDIRIEISSPGGFVFEGLEIFNLLRDYSRQKTTVLMGLAASMASYLCMAGDRVIAHDNSIFMIHNVWNIAIGDHAELRKQADVIESTSNLIAQAYARKSGKVVDEVRQLMDEETYYFGQEILDAGFVDEIIGTGKGAADRDSAMSEARASISSALARVQAQNQDFGRIAALVRPSGAPERVRALRTYASADPGNELLQAAVERLIREGADPRDAATVADLSIALRDGNPIDLEAARLAGMTLDEFKKWNLVSANKQY